MHSPQHLGLIPIFGTLTGTVFIVCAMIEIHDYLKTIILAFVGAIVSFVVTLVLKKAMIRFEK